MLKNLLAATLLSALLTGCSQTSSTTTAPGDNSGRPTSAADLPLPSAMANKDYEALLYPFLGSFRYRALGWEKDKRIRDTGPYKNGKYFGTHPAVKIYYSPEVMTWLNNGRRGEIPDGAMIVKEMYPPPAARYAGKPEPLPTEWTVMVRDKAGSADGWYWAYYGNGVQPDNDDFPFSYPNSGFGSYCVRCHGSASSLLTFVSLDNVENYPGEPIEYEDDGSWREDGDGPGPEAHPNKQELAALKSFLGKTEYVNQAWLAQYPQFPAGAPNEIQHLPPSPSARVTAQQHRQFVTSDQCMSCHAGDNSNFGPNLISGDTDVSPWGEWQWSMMGLAGRDPIFYSQLETESTLYAKPGAQLSPEQIQNLCLHCHGVMGQRQFTADHPGQNYTLQVAQDPKNGAYHSLHLDGVSCTVCHQIQDPGEDVVRVQTGNFDVAPRVNGRLQIFGPFPQPEPTPMRHALAADPVHSPHIQKANLCASCHTVFLPVLDTSGKVLGHKYEQATYFEWQNSVYRDGGPRAQTCQQCHMPQGFGNDPVDPVKLANVQDQDFPPSDNVADVKVQRRQGYRRHMLMGINVFGLQMFQSFPDILGVNLDSFMTGFDNGLARSMQNAAEQASRRSAKVEILDAAVAGNVVTARVRSTNLAGHRFPSGVGFRRLFLEFLVLDGNGQVVWGSGRSNALGILVDEQGNPLPSEFHVNGAFQPHHQVVDRQDRAQIYEELTLDSEGKFTTSFLGRVQELKDNRLLPAGWNQDGNASLQSGTVESTRPHGEAAADPDFTDGKGSDTLTYRAQLPPSVAGPLKVQATLFYQATPPRYMKDRFDASQGPGTRRLHFLASHIDDARTHFPGWKLRVGQADRTL